MSATKQRRTHVERAQLQCYLEFTGLAGSLDKISMTASMGVWMKYLQERPAVTRSAVNALAARVYVSRWSSYSTQVKEVSYRTVLGLQQELTFLVMRMHDNRRLLRQSSACSNVLTNSIMLSIAFAAGQTRTGIRRSTSKLSAEVTKRIEEHNLLVEFIKRPDEPDPQAPAASVGTSMTPDEVFNLVKDALDGLRTLRSSSRQTQEQRELEQPMLTREIAEALVRQLCIV